jgi:hypothetical protein
MKNHRPRRLTGSGWATVLIVAGLVLLDAPEARSQAGAPARQVTLFGIVATPNATAVDPKLRSIAPQLRRLLPNHGFKLLDVQSKRLVVGRTVTCNLGDGYTAATTLVQPLDEDGKVQLRCEIGLNDVPQLATVVATPPNQLFFCDKMLNNGSRLLIGVGAR